MKEDKKISVEESIEKIEQFFGGYNAVNCPKEFNAIQVIREVLKDTVKVKEELEKELHETKLTRDSHYDLIGKYREDNKKLQSEIAGLKKGKDKAFRKGLEQGIDD